VNILIRDFYFIVIITKAIIDLSTEKNYLIMGTEPIKLTKYTTFSKGTELLKDFQCSDCDLFIDDKDIEEHNYYFEVSDYANEITKEVSLSGKDYVYGVEF
jgi:hypothetical protein